MVHNLQPLNGVTIWDSAVPPFTDQTAEDFGGRGCYGMLDLYVAFDQQELDVSSRDDYVLNSVRNIQTYSNSDGVDEFLPGHARSCHLPAAGPDPRCY